MASFPGQPGKPAPENKANLDYDKERNDGLRVALSKPYAKNLHFPQKDKMPAPHHSMFTGQMLFPTPSQQRQSTKSYFFLCKQINNILYIYKKQSKSKIKTPFLSNLICFNLAHTDIAGTCVCLSVCMFNCVSLSRSMLLCSASTSS